MEHKSILLVVIEPVDVSPCSYSNLRCIADKWKSGCLVVNVLGGHCDVIINLKITFVVAPNVPTAGVFDVRFGFHENASGWNIWGNDKSDFQIDYDVTMPAQNMLDLDRKSVV